MCRGVVVAGVLFFVDVAVMFFYIVHIYEYSCFVVVSASLVMRQVSFRGDARNANANNGYSW